MPAGTQLIRMANEFGADINYLLTGHGGGAAPALRPDEAALLDNYRKSPADGRERLRQISITAAQSDKRKKA